MVQSVECWAKISIFFNRQRFKRTVNDPFDQNELIQCKKFTNLQMKKHTVRFVDYKLVSDFFLSMKINFSSQTDEGFLSTYNDSKL